VSEDAREKVRELIDLHGGSEVVDKAEELLDEVSGAEEIIEEFRKIKTRLQQMGVEEYKIDWGIARGLEYYTGSVFEVYSEDVQLGGGGRYDGLIESLGGEPTPAVGVGFGVDRIAGVLGENEKEIEENGLDAMIIPTGRSMLKEGLKTARELRKDSLKVDIDLMGRSLSKALGYADSREARYSIIVGPDDISEGRVTLRDMRTGDQERVFKEAVPKRLNADRDWIRMLNEIRKKINPG